MDSTREFYKELGKRMYAVAKADKKIHSTDVKMLKKLIREDIMPLENRTREV